MAKVSVEGAPYPYIKFLGTAGARFVMIKQLRASGGIWLSYRDTNILIDPGPGSIVRCSLSRPKLDPSKLDAIILTHRHLDHSSDINVMIEAMTEGGFKKRGTVFCPRDALGESGVILKYALDFPQGIKTLRARSNYKVGDISFETSMRHIHPVETYGLKFRIGDKSVALLTDTKYFPQLAGFYRADILIICVVFSQMRPEIEHLSLPEAVSLIRDIKPGKAVLTHFGMTMLNAKPHIQAERLSKELGVEVAAAYDGMSIKL
ncbi:MAG: MBL fold metallo-hydrolase [Candidatus Omnitrophica bacterium]|nr:MBL fold metallo-hydrolase [Candidatus Omnitrophota bacterium]